MLPLLCSSPPLPLASAQEQNADRNFLAKKAAIVEEYTKQKKSFADQISRLEKEKRDLEDKAQGLNLKALKSKTLLTILSLSDFGITILLWFFPVMVLNQFLYLIIRKREFFARHRVLVITLFAAVEICFFLPLAAFAQVPPPAASASENQKADEFDRKLQEVNALLKMSPAEECPDMWPG